jgi:hypothetical protein
MHQVDLMKDDKGSAKMAKEGDVHVKLTRVDMLMQRDCVIKVIEFIEKEEGVDGC